MAKSVPSGKRQLSYIKLVNTTFKYKDQITGFVKFTGELYNYSVLTSEVICGCFDDIMLNLNSNNSIDCICILMNTVGKKLFNEHGDIANGYFDKLKLLSDGNKINKKENFALMDLFDLKKEKKW